VCLVSVDIYTPVSAGYLKEADFEESKEKGEGRIKISRNARGGFSPHIEAYRARAASKRMGSSPNPASPHGRYLQGLSLTTAG
jgi:hypothetical protein